MASSTIKPIAKLGQACGSEIGVIPGLIPFPVPLAACLPVEDDTVPFQPPHRARSIAAVATLYVDNDRGRYLLPRAVLRYRVLENGAFEPALRSPSSQVGAIRLG
jgi:hypothetical protein